MIIEYIIVFIFAAIPWFEIGLVIPLAIIAGLSPFWVILISIVGNLSTIIPIVYGFEKVKAYLAKRPKKEKRTKRQSRARDIWKKYGLPGLALLGPILLGIHIATIIGLSLGASKHRTLLWMTISLVFWGLLFGIVTILGFNVFVRE